ncbi:MAG: competence/damage-inducible protein A [bacterium]
MKKARIIIIGDEILHGEVADENGPWLINQLNSCNVEVQSLHIVPDEIETIARHCTNPPAVDYTLVTGGIGPTHDDRTRTAIARAADKELVEHEQVMNWLENHYEEKLNKPRRGLARLPEGSQTIYLPETPAIAFQVENFYVFPGIPELLKPLFKKWEHKFTGDECYSYSLTLMALEGDIAEELEKLQNKFSTLQFGSYPHGKTITLLVRGYDKQEFEEGKKALKKLAENFQPEAN